MIILWALSILEQTKPPPIAFGFKDTHFAIILITYFSATVQNIVNYLARWVYLGSTVVNFKKYSSVTQNQSYNWDVVGWWGQGLTQFSSYSFGMQLKKILLLPTLVSLLIQLVMLLMFYLQSLWLRRLLDRTDVEVAVPSCWSPFSRNSLQLASFEGEEPSAHPTLNYQSVCEVFVSKGWFINHANYQNCDNIKMSFLTSYFANDPQHV